MSHVITVSDINVYSTGLGTVGFNFPIDDRISDVSWVCFSNESGANLIVSMGLTNFIVPAWFYWPVPISSENMSFPINIQGTFLKEDLYLPTYALFCTVYLNGEDPPDNWKMPISLVRAITIGNAVTVAKADQVANDNNGAGTTFVEASALAPFDNTSHGSNVVIQNDGTTVISENQASDGSLLGLFSIIPGIGVVLGNIGRVTNALGDIDVEGAFNVDGSSTLKAISATTVTATGAVSGASVAATNAVTGANATISNDVAASTEHISGQANVGSLVSGGAISGTTLTTTGAVAHGAGNVTTTGSGNFGVLNTTGTVSHGSGSVTTTGQVNAATIVTTSTINSGAGAITTTGAVNAGSVVSTGAISGTTITGTGAVTGSSLKPALGTITRITFGVTPSSVVATSSLTVTHGLGVIPTAIFICGQSGSGTGYVDGVTSTQFVLHNSSAAGISLYYWLAIA